MAKYVHAATLAESKKQLKSLIKRREELYKEIEEIEQHIKITDIVVRLRTRMKLAGYIPKLNGVYKKDIPLEYDKRQFLEKRVLFILNKLKEASVKDISNFIIKAEKNSDYDSTYRKVQQVMIKMTKENKVTKLGDYASTYKLNVIDK